MEELYNKLFEAKMYTGSFEQFKSDYGTPAGAAELHAGLSQGGMYSSDLKTFGQDYGLTVNEDVQEQEDIEVSEKNAIVDNNYWNSNEQGSVGQLFQSMGVTRDDITVDEDGNYTIGGESEITVPTKWALEHMGLPINYEDAGSSSMSVNDFFSEYGVDKVWKDEESQISFANDIRTDTNARQDYVFNTELAIGDLWGKVEKAKYDKDRYKVKKDGLYYTSADGVAAFDEKVADIIDGNYILTTKGSALQSHRYAVQAIEMQNELDAAANRKTKDKNKVRKELGKKNMPAITNEDLKKDDANIEALFNKYMRFGFTFDTSMLEGDKVTIVADNGDRLTVGVDRDTSEEELADIDAWMRSRAVDKGSTFDAHLESVGIDKNRKVEIDAEQTENYNKLISSISSVEDTANRSRNEQFQTVGSVWDFMNSAEGQGTEALGSVETAIDRSGNRIRIPEEWKGEDFDTLGGTSNVLNTMWEAAQIVAKEDFLNQYRKADGTKLTEKERSQFFEENSVASREERDAAVKTIENNAKAVSVDNKRLKSYTIDALSKQSQNDEIRRNIADSVESLGSNLFTKYDTQQVLRKAAEEEIAQVTKDQADAIAQAKVFDNKLKENVEQINTIYEDILNFDFDNKLKEIRNRDLSTPEAVAQANKDIAALQSEYKSMYGKYQSLIALNKTLLQGAKGANERLEEVKLDVSNLELYKEYIDDNHAIGTQLWVALSDASIDLFQGAVGAVEMVYDFASVVGSYVVEGFAQSIGKNADPSVQALVHSMRGDASGSFEMSHGFVDGMHEWIDDWQTERAMGIQQVSLSDVDSTSDFGEWASVMLAGQVPNLALMYLTGGSSLYVMGATSAGQSYNDMRAQNKLYMESGGLYGTQHSFASMFMTSSLTGAAEALSEKVTLGQFNKAKLSIRGLIDDVGFQAGAKKYLKEMVFSPTALKTYAKDTLEEGFSESLATLSQNLLAINSGQEDVGIFDGLEESFVSGVMLSNFMKTPQLARHVKNTFASRRYYDLVEANQAEINILETRLRTEELTSSQRKSIEKKIGKLVAETTEQLEKDVMKADALSDDHKGRLFEIDKERARLQREANETANIENEQESKDALAAINAEWAELQVEKENILNEYKDKDVEQRYKDVVENTKAYIDAVNKANEGNEKIELQEGTSDEFAQWQLDNMGAAEWRQNTESLRDALMKVLEDPRTSPARKRSTQKMIDNLNNLLSDQADAKFNYGAQVPVFNKNGNLTGHKIFINKETSIEDGMFTTGAHEFLHAALHNTIKENPAVADALAASVLQAIKDSGTDFDARYFNRRMQGYPSDQRSNETLTVLSEMLIAGQLEFNDSVWVKIGDFIRQAFSRFSSRDIKLDTAKDVKNFLKDYAKSIEKGYVNKRIVQMAVKGAEGAIIEEARKKQETADEADAFNEISRQGSFSKAMKREVANNPDLKAKFDKFVKTEDGARKYKSKDDFKASTDFSKAYLEIMEGRALDGLIQQGMTDLGIPPSAMREFTRDVKDNISMRLIENFDPAINESLFGWLTGVSGGAGRSIIYRAKGDVMKAYRDSGRAQTVSMDAVLGEDSTFAEGISDTSATAADTAVDQAVEDAGKMAVDTVKLKPTTKSTINNSITNTDIKLEGLTYKGVKKLVKGKDAPLKDILDVVAEDFGITGKKIVENKDLDSKQRKAAQEFIKDNAEALLELLPEGQTASGEATGLPRVLLNKFYVKGERARTSEGATAAGKFTQTKRSDITTQEFLEAFGIKEDGTFDNNKKVDGAIRAIAEQTAMIAANQALRVEAINNEKAALSVIALVGDGKSGGMFSTRIKDSKKKQVVLSTVGSIDNDLSLENKLIFWDGLSNVVKKAILQNNVNSIKDAIESEFADYPQIKSKAKQLANRLSAAMQPMLQRAGVAKIKDVEKKASKVSELLQAQNLSDGNKVAAFVKDSVGAKKRFQDPKYSENVEKFRGADKAYLNEIYDPSDIPGFFRKVTMLQKSSTTSPRRAQAYTAANGKHIKMFTDMLLVGNFDSKTGVATSSVDPDLTFKLKKDGGVDTKTVKYKGEAVEINTTFVANTSKQGKKDLTDPAAKAKRRADELFAQEYLVERFESWANMYNNGDISNIELGMLISSELSSMDSALRRAAMLKYVSEDAFTLSDKDLRYEHMLPAVVVAIGMMDAIVNGDGVSAARKILSQYTVQIIGKEFDKAITDSGLASAIPEGTNINTPGVNITRNYTVPGDARIKKIIDVDTNTIVKISEVYDEYTKLLESNNNTQREIEDIKIANKMQPMANFSKRKPKGASVWDFDDTLATTKSSVLFTAPDGTKGKLNAEEYARDYVELAAQGYEFDFSEFNKVVDGKPGPLFNEALERAKKFGTKDQFILTARAPQAQEAIFEFLKGVGLEIPAENIVGLGNSTGEAKARWIAENLIAEGYNDLYFADDALQNVTAVQEMFDTFDIKGVVQQAKANFSKRLPKEFDSILGEGEIDLDQDFNIILEQTMGIGRFKEFSPGKARKRGRKKNRFTFFIPPSANDFEGLIYSFLGKGKVGDKHHEWFKKNLFDPFTKGIRHLNRVQQLVANDLKELRKAAPEIRNKLKDNAPGLEYTFEDAIRVYSWNKAGFEIPGLSQTDLNAIVKAVEADAKLSAFADSVLTINSKLASDMVAPDDSWMSGTIASDLNDAAEASRATYLNEWIERKNIIFSKKNLNKIEAVYGSNFREALEDVLFRMENGGNRSKGQGRLMNNFMNWIHGSIGTTMFFNARSAVLQMISNVNFINWSDNNMLAAAKAFANQPQYWKDVAMIFNSDFLKQRRGRIQTDVNAAELLAEIRDSKNPMKKATAYLLQLGFTPTQIADSFAIATGGATFYRNRVNSLIAEGKTQQEAGTQAFEDMMEIAEATQQSTREDRISQQQASPLGKFILAFQNTPMQYNRLIKKAAQDLVNGRGDATANVSKIVYYGAIQNMIFYGLQQALFAAMFGDDEEDKIDDKQKERIINGMLDTVLRGSGIGGAVVSTTKNVIMKFMEQEEKAKDDKFFTEPDHAYTVIEALNISPPIGIKARKLYSALQSWEFNREVIDHMDKTDIDNPMYDAIFSGTEALTNLPLSRLYNKYQNIKEAANADHELWKRVAMLLGWSRWSFGIKNQDVMAAKNEVKEIKAEEREERQEQKKLERQIAKDEEERQVIEDNKLDQDEKREEGAAEVQCAAVSRSGKRCSNAALDGKSFCTVHDEVPQQENEVQCSHIKSNGERCKMKTKNKSGKCYYHD